MHIWHFSDFISKRVSFPKIAFVTLLMKKVKFICDVSYYKIKLKNEVKTFKGKDGEIIFWLFGKICNFVDYKTLPSSLGSCRGRVSK